MAYRADTDDPTANVPLMTALGRLVVRASELDEDVAAVLARLCDAKTKKQLKRKSLYWKLSAVQSIADQLHAADDLFTDLSDFCAQCLAKLDDRNSPVHSTYLWDDELGIIKWDPRQGPEVIKAEDIEKAAAELHRFGNRAVVYNLSIQDLRRQGVIEAEYVPVRPVKP